MAQSKAKKRRQPKLKYLVDFKSYRQLRQAEKRLKSLQINLESQRKRLIIIRRKVAEALGGRKAIEVQL